MPCPVSKIVMSSEWVSSYPDIFTFRNDLLTFSHIGLSFVDYCELKFVIFYTNGSSNFSLMEMDNRIALNRENCDENLSPDDFIMEIHLLDITDIHSTVSIDLSLKLM